MPTCPKRLNDEAATTPRPIKRVERPRHLTREQAQFAHYVASGLTLTESYLRSHKTAARRAQGTQWNNGSRLAKAHAVAAYIEQLRAENAALAAADRTEKLRILEHQLRDPDLPPRERREAIKLHNEMTGDNAPVKHEITFTKDDFTALALDLAS